MRAYIPLCIRAAVGGIWFGANLHSMAPPTVATLGPPAEHAGAVSTTLPVPTIRDTPPATQPRRLEMLALYNSGLPLRSLVYQAMKRPDEGGYAYAWIMLAQCELPPEKLAARLPPAQLEALARLRTRCDMTIQEKRQFESLFTDRRGHARHDPLWKAMTGQWEASTSAEHGESKRQLLAMQDPIVLDILLAANPAESGLAINFAGQQYDSNGFQQIDHAILLAYCKLGVHCSSDATLAMRLCMDKGWCGGSVEEALRTGSGNDFPAIEALAGRISQEFKRRNLAAFQPAT